MASLDLHEKANFTRLSRLLVDKGTEALRNTFDGIHSPANLPAVLSANKTSLLKLKPRVINDFQWDLLYPPCGNPPDSKTFDVTLLTILFRNICGLSTTGWGVMPVNSDRSMQANIVRIRLFRNDVYAHVTSTQVDNMTFESLWNKISQALVDLNIPQKDLDELKNCSIGPREEECVAILKDWKSHEEECLFMLEGLNSEVKSIKSSINRLTQIMEEDRDVEINRSREKDEDLLRKLAKHNFKSKIRSKVMSFLPGTREWLLNNVDEWFNEDEQESKILLLTAGPGFGKSVFSAKVCEDFRKKRKLGACHFCHFGDSNLSNPRAMLQSLASQMCENVVGFEEKLIDQLKRPHEVENLKDAFGIYLQNPLDELELAEPILIVIDGLDESAADEKSGIVNLIAKHFPDLPEFIKVLVTSRPGLTVAELRDFPNINVENSNSENNSDLKIYLKSCLPTISKRNEDSGAFEMLVEMCEGSFLYASIVQNELKKRVDIDQLTLDEIMKFVPKGLESHYRQYFRRLEDELKTVIRGNFNILKVLEVLVASKAPLPLTFITRALGLSLDCGETKKIISKVNEALSCLFYVSDDLVTVFHKSVVDWLLARRYKDHEYTVKISDGDKSLWLLCEETLEEVKENWYVERDENGLTKDAVYALNYGFLHLVDCDMKECFPWLVDAVILHALLTISPEKSVEVAFLLRLWKGVLQSDATLSDDLRARISWHVVEIQFLVKKIATSPTNSGSPFDDCRTELLPFLYLQSVLTYSPKNYFSENEMNFLSERFSSCCLVDILSDVEKVKVDVMPRAIWCPTSTKTVKAFGMSKNKTMAAVGQRHGRISIVRVPSLVELWKFSTEGYVSCCTFSPDDSLVLFGELQYALSIAERKEVPFFDRHNESFKSCAFSPNGKRLTTSDGSSSIKVWDVPEQSLLSLLSADVRVNRCSFSATGMFITANWKYDADHSITTLSNNEDDDFEYYPDFDEEESDAEDSYCVWNAITWQRCDGRSLHERKLEKGEASQDKPCKRCSQPKFDKVIFDVEPFIPLESRKLPYESLSTGIYHDVECIFALGEKSLSVIENTHFTTFAVWNCFFDGIYDFIVKRHDEKKIFREITAIGDRQWLYADVKKLIFFFTSVPTLPTQVLWSSFSPDSSRISTCTSDGFVNIWNVSTGKVVQRFKCSQGKSPFACCWTVKFLFVFDYLNGIPSLTNYSVGVNSKITLSQRQQVPLVHVAEEFVQLSSVVGFSDGLLCFECGKTSPVKVLDFNNVEKPQMVMFPGIEPKMSITVSPDASFVFGDKECREKKPVKVLENSILGGTRIVTRSPPFLYGFDNYLPGAVFVGAERNKYYIWKRKSEAVYEYYSTHPGIPLRDNRGVISCFSNDSNVIVLAYRLLGRPFLHSRIIDLHTGQNKDLTFQYSNLTNSKLFCINKDGVVVAVSSDYITVLDMESGAFLGCSFQRYFTENLLMQIKLSPNGTTLAFPKINGDVEFLRLSIVRYLLSRLKCKAAVERNHLIEGLNSFHDLFDN